MRATEMLTAAGGAAAGTTTPSTASVAGLTGGVPSAGAGAGAGAGGNFPLGAALLAFAFANFVNILSIWNHERGFMVEMIWLRLGDVSKKDTGSTQLTCRLKEKKWDARKFLTSSGIISSLSAAVASLAVAVGQQEGGASSVFALALVFAAVVMYDASGVRFHTGRQAALLNQIVSDLSPEHPIISTFRPLREPLGHSPFQVFAGALVGCTVAYVMGRSV